MLDDSHKDASDAIEYNLKRTLDSAANPRQLMRVVRHSCQYGLFRSDKFLEGEFVFGVPFCFGLAFHFLRAGAARIDTFLHDTLLLIRLPLISVLHASDLDEVVEEGEEGRVKVVEHRSGFGHVKILNLDGFGEDVPRDMDILAVLTDKTPGDGCQSQVVGVSVLEDWLTSCVGVEVERVSDNGPREEDTYVLRSVGPRRLTEGLVVSRRPLGCGQHIPAELLVLEVLAKECLVVTAPRVRSPTLVLVEEVHTELQSRAQ